MKAKRKRCLAKSGPPNSNTTRIEERRRKRACSWTYSSCLNLGPLFSEFGKALTLITLTFVSNMVAYFHSSITRFHFGLPGLLTRFLYLYLRHFGIIGVMSMLSIGWVIVLSIQTINEQLAQHGTPTGQLSVQQLPSLAPKAGKQPSNEKPPQKAPSWRDWSPTRRPNKHEKHT